MVEDQDDGAELRVLVVDDNVDAATSLSYLLQLLGCKTATAFGGHMACRVARLFQPSLVVLDLDMPGPDGCAVLQALQEQDDGPVNALYVCLTGRNEPGDRQRCLEAGFHHFHSKPLLPEELAALLAEARQRLVQGLPPGAASSSSHFG